MREINTPEKNEVTKRGYSYFDTEIVDKYRFFVYVMDSKAERAVLREGVKRTTAVYMY